MNAGRGSSRGSLARAGARAITPRKVPLVSPVKGNAFSVDHV